MLMHEAAIGKTAGDQIVKLMTLGLTEEEAKAEILDDFFELGAGAPPHPHHHRTRAVPEGAAPLLCKPQSEAGFCHCEHRATTFSAPRTAGETTKEPSGCPNSALQPAARGPLLSFVRTAEAHLPESGTQCIEGKGHYSAASSSPELPESSTSPGSSLPESSPLPVSPDSSGAVQ